MGSKAETPKAPRGEIAELTASLQNLCLAGKRSDKELRTQKKDVFKKVINYLTVGMDMSSLFPSMTSCANLTPDDIVLKKMLYLYIAHYATQTPDLALLTINQLHKDCVDQDPLVRGLALRSLCSLRLPNFLEYVSSPVLSGLTDRHPYVRRTAVMGVLKIYHVDRVVVENTGMLETVQGMLRTDSDPQVLANCLTVLLQVTDPAQLLDRSLIYNLINKLKEFSEWGQCQVLDLVGRFSPASEAEVYELLNAMEDRLAHSNSAVALAATKAFLHLTLEMPATHQQVLERIKEPLKSVIGRDDPAVTYAVLSNVLLLAQRAPMIFENEYTTFYCRTHDPWYIKKLKMEILAALASSSNVYEVVNELTEYARDSVHPHMAREAVRSVGKIALAIPDTSGIVERLLIFLESGCDAVVAESLVVMKDLLRRFPEMAEVVVAQVMTAVTQGQALASCALGEPQARAAMLWIMGQFGQFIQEAPYLLEQLLDSFSSEDDEVKLAFLTAAAQLFFRRPPECQSLLGSALAAGLADTNQDVRDRALRYYRLLRLNIAEAERIINPPLMAVMSFSEALTSDMKDTIFKEFNSLSVCYQVPAATFISPTGGYHSLLEEEEQHAGSEPRHEQAHVHIIDNSTNLLDDSDDVGLVDAGPHQPPAANQSYDNALDLLDFVPGPTPAATTSPGQGGLLGDFTAAAPAVNSGLDLMGLDGLGGLGFSPPPAQPPVSQAAPPSANTLYGLDDMLGFGSPAPAPAQPAAAVPQLELDPNGRLAAPNFQAKWKGLAVSHQFSESLSPATVHAMAANNHQDLCAHLKQGYIQTMASGGQPPVFKYYFYGQTRSGSACLVEMVVSTSEQQAHVTFKSELGPTTPQFVELFTNCLAGFMQ